MATGPKQYLFTSESVTEGHPDKIADQISDGVLDAVLAQDPNGRVACETLVNTGLVVVSGEISTTASFDIQDIARETIRQIGYIDAAGLQCRFVRGPERRRQAVGRHRPGRRRRIRVPPSGDADELDLAGAGDQGMMFGYATQETPELMPLPIALAHRLARRLAEVRKDETLPYLRPDGKTQVSVRYVDGRPVGIEKLLISTQHSEGSESSLRDDLFEHVVRPGCRPSSYDETRARAGLPGQPDRPVRHRRPGRRLRPHRAQDHRRHLRRNGPSRRRRLQRQGPVQGRPLSRLRRPLGGQERRRCRPRRSAARCRSPTRSASPARCR